MSYLPDYITWRGDLPFAADPANDLDTLVMAALSYIDLPAETQGFAQCAKSVPPDDPDDHFRGECRRLLQQIAKSSRFGALTVRDAVSVLNDEIQFAAMTVDLPDGTHIIAFRGTDGSLTGWREDFAMSFESPVPAQAAAQKYLERHLTQDAGDVIVTGHSKGETSPCMLQRTPRRTCRGASAASSASTGRVWMTKPPRPTDTPPWRAASLPMCRSLRSWGC